MVPQFLTCPLGYVRAVYAFLNAVLIAITDSLILVLIYPIRFVFPQLYVTIESLLYSKCGEAFISPFCLFPKMKMYAEGLEDIDPVTRSRAVVITNHQDSGDVPAMMNIVAYFEIARTTTWIIDRMFRWTPFGIVSQWHKDFFSQEGKGSREKVIKKIQTHFSTTYFERGHKWLVFFPEGGYVKNRGESARRFAKANGLPELYNCSTPRATAFVEIVRAFRGEINPVSEPVEYVVDCTIGYKGPADLLVSDVLRGSYSDKEVHYHFKTYRLADLPTDPDELTTWLYERYAEKEVMLGHFKEHGTFTGKAHTPMHMPTGRILGAWLFWNISALFVYDVYYRLISNIYHIVTGYL